MCLGLLSYLWANQQNLLLAFYYLCETIASKCIGFYISLNQKNIVNLMSKHWSYASNQVCVLCMFFQQEDTFKIVEDTMIC